MFLMEVKLDLEWNGFLTAPGCFESVIKCEPFLTLSWTDVR